MPHKHLLEAQANIKSHIVERSIDADQIDVAKHWLNTFKFNEKNDTATTLAKLALACIAEGDFKTRSALISNKLMPPPKALFSIDYLSHASRIIIDYQGLAENNKQQFLKFFPAAGERNVVSRCATHAVIREKETITELKGFMLGVSGQLPTFIKTAYDFGVNIAMGGEDQTNWVGKRITANGFSGHFYFHHNSPHQLMMVGLEQSAPASSLVEAILGHASHDERTQDMCDQFGQSHSLIGASDTYTAAGSLYFSNPVYLSKLLNEKRTAAPDKYDAMHVTLTNENWVKVMEYLTSLNHKIQQADSKQAIDLLLTPPRTATDEPQAIISFIALDFSAYFHGISVLFDEVSQQLKQQLLTEQGALLSHINQLKKGNKTDSDFQAFIKQLQALYTRKDIPIPYAHAIKRIEELFEKQRYNDKKLDRMHTNLLLQQGCSDLLEQIILLEEKAALFYNIFSSDYIAKEDDVAIFLQALTQHSKQLEQIKSSLHFDVRKSMLEEPMQESLAESAQQQSALEKSWLGIAPLTLERLSAFQSTVQATAAVFSNPPRLLSAARAVKIDQVNQALSQEIQRHTTILKQNEEAIIQLKAAVNSKEDQIVQQQQAITRQEADIALMARDKQQAQQESELLTTKNQQLTLEVESTAAQQQRDKVKLDRLLQQHIHDLQTAAQTIKRLEQQNTALFEQIDVLNKQVQSLDEELRLHKEHESAQEQTLVSSRLELKQAQLAHTNLKQKYQQSAKKLVDLQHALSQEQQIVQNQLNAQIQQLASTSQCLATTKKDLESSQASNSVLQQQNSSLNEQISELNKQKQSLSEELRLRKERESAQDHALKSSQIQLEQAQLAHTNLKQKYQQNANELADLQHALHHAQQIGQNQLHTQIKQLDSTSQSLSTTRKDLETSQAKNSVLQQQNSSLNEQISGLNKQEQSLSEELRLRKERESAQDHALESSHIQLEKAQLAHTNLKQQYQQKANELADLQHTLHHVQQIGQNQLKAQIKQLDSTSQCLATTKKELESSQARNSVLQQQILDLSEENRHKNVLVEELKDTIQHLREEHVANTKQATNNNEVLIKDITNTALINLAPIFIHIKKVDEHAESLKARGYKSEYGVAKQLSDNIRHEIDQYLLRIKTTSQDEALKHFSTSCQNHIVQATPILAVHRGWKKTLGNLAACILGLVVGYVTAAAINYQRTGQFFFFNQTKSMRKITALEDDLAHFVRQESHKN